MNFVMLNSSWSVHFGWAFRRKTCMYICMYVYICMHVYINIYITYVPIYFLYTTTQQCTVQLDAQSLNARSWPLQKLIIRSKNNTLQTMHQRPSHNFLSLSSSFCLFLWRRNDTDKHKDYHTTTRRHQDENATPTRRPRHNDSDHDSNTRKRRDGRDYHRTPKRQEHNLKRRHRESDHDNDREKDMLTTTWTTSRGTTTT